MSLAGYQVELCPAPPPVLSTVARRRYKRVMELVVLPTGEAVWDGRRLRCALGRCGVRADKREADGATPAGAFAMRRVLYRSDRVPAPVSALAVRALTPADGWCDDPADGQYNRQVRLPFAGHHELLWRDDHIYDLIVVLGHNDDPVVPELGSAVFLHLARPQYPATEGCIALAAPDLRSVLSQCGADSVVRVGP